MALKAFFTVLYLLCIPTAGKAFDKEPLNQKGCSFADMQRFYLEELGVAHVSIKIVEKQLDDPRVKGYTKHIDNNSYLIVLAKYLEPSEIRVTMAHELVHVRQLEKGQIKREEFIKDYHERSFEDEAFRLSLPLAAKFYTQMDCSGKQTPKTPATSSSVNPGFLSNNELLFAPSLTLWFDTPNYEVTANTNERSLQFQGLQKTYHP